MLNNIVVPKNIGEEDGFKSLVESIKGSEGYKNPLGFAISRNDVVEVLNEETGEYEDRVAQCSMPVVNFKKDVGENLGSAAIMHLALSLQGVELKENVSEAVYSLDLKTLKTAIGLFTAYIPESEEFEDKHLNIQMLLDLEEMMENSADYMPQSVHGTKRDDISIVFIYEDKPVKSVQAAYLKLHAISLGKVALRSLKLDGAFGVMSNVAWCEVNNTIVPVSLDYLRDNERRLKLHGNYPIVRGNDKFPQYLDHVIPADNTRILETGKVRFGAQLAAGTIVMPGASYINFNAGTTGPVMVEGRISSSAIVGKGSDIGGGASIQGVLSGGNSDPISIGVDTLLGANSFVGMSIGNSCIVDAGVSVRPQSTIYISLKEKSKIEEANPCLRINGATIKAKVLQGLDGIHFRYHREGVKGVELSAFRSTREVVLNEDLH